MKKFFQILMFLSTFTFVSCEEDIILDFDKTVPRLVIEANIFAEESVYNKIHLSTTTDYYSNVYPSIDDAQVSIKDLSNNVDYSFLSIGNGDFSNLSFRPQNDIMYELTVIYKDEIYKAVSTPLEAPEIVDIQQTENNNLGGEWYEFRFHYQDNPDEENYYLSQMIAPTSISFGTWNDQFDNGNLTNDLFLFLKEDVQSGDTLYYAINSINKEYYNYLSKILSISGSATNPFASPMGTIKGNIVNQTNKDNYALGYFHLAKRNHYTY
ncbi:MAG TPA: DUF4249 family protein, partial [Flavobacterium sp.]|nr:DUF4249 family protein [Flavobacterium sp.]